MMLQGCSENSSHDPKEENLPSRQSKASSRLAPRTSSDLGRINGNAMISNAALCEKMVGAEGLAACAAACKLNHSNSCANWGSMLEAQDFSSAKTLFIRACKGGSGIGCESLAELEVREGGDASATFLNARRYHRIHCEQGYTRSCRQLAGLYRNGLGGPVNLGRASMFQSMARSLEATKIARP